VRSTEATHGGAGRGVADRLSWRRDLTIRAAPGTVSATGPIDDGDARVGGTLAARGSPSRITAAPTKNKVTTVPGSTFRVSGSCSGFPGRTEASNLERGTANQEPERRTRTGNVELGTWNYSNPLDRCIRSYDFSFSRQNSSTSSVSSSMCWLNLTVNGFV